MGNAHLGVELLDAVTLLLDHPAKGCHLLLQPDDLHGELLRIGFLRGGAGLGGARAGGLEEETGQGVRGITGMLADGTHALLLAAQSVLQPLLQATRIKNHEAIAGLGQDMKRKKGIWRVETEEIRGCGRCGRTRGERAKVS
jgi:hypothetical protein